MSSTLVQINFISVCLDTSLQALFDNQGTLDDKSINVGPIAVDEYYGLWEKVREESIEVIAIRLLNSLGKEDREKLTKATRMDLPAETFQKLVHLFLVGLRNCLVTSRPRYASGKLSGLLESKMGPASIRYAGEVYRCTGYGMLSSDEVIWPTRILADYKDTCKAARERYGREYDDGYKRRADASTSTSSLSMVPAAASASVSSVEARVTSQVTMGPPRNPAPRRAVQQVKQVKRMESVPTQEQGP